MRLQTTSLFYEKILIQDARDVDKTLQFFMYRWGGQWMFRSGKLQKPILSRLAGAANADRKIMNRSVSL
ncbi:hypothetical protein HC766_08155 [Candidatus Gracilibacteria bacterium]|nr:hypothetical protein [Candidatus Gracilibacteria bacterium]